MRLISELRRRNVIRMAVLYIVAAWLIMQVAEVVFTLGRLPDWTGPATLLVLAVGFPIALIFSWFYELTPEVGGIEQESGLDARPSRIGGRRLDFVAIAVLSAALLVFAADKWLPRGPVAQSIAVLPFANLSHDPGQEYFSDGISEELLGVLARIPDMRVISRTSAFAFKERRVPLSEIASELRVAHVLDGSVRMAGNRVRITAQLVDAQSDTQLWAETFDREFEDIFAIQDEIAAAVIEALEVRIAGARPSVRETSPEAYALYLQGVHLAKDLTTESLQEANKLFEEVLAMDPDYAPAWDYIANNYVFLAGYGILPFEEGFSLANQAIDKALEIDPNLAHPHALRGRIARGTDNDLAAAARHYRRALELDPTHDDVLRGSAVLLLSLNRIEEAMAFNEYALDRDPVNPVSYGNLGMGYLFAERWDDAITVCRKALSLSPNFIAGHYCIGEALLFRGDAELARAEFAEEPLESLKLIGLTMAYHAMGDFERSDAAMAELIDKHGDSWAAQIAYAADYRGEIDKAFEWLDKAVQYKDPGLSEIFTGTLYLKNSRTDPRWEALLRSLGYAPEQLARIEFDVSVPIE